MEKGSNLMTENMLPIGSSDLVVAPLVLGGNVFGWTADQQASFDVLDAFVAGGGNFIDTADGYSAWVPGHTGGESETIIGEWMRTRGNRGEVVIATKVSTHPRYSGLSPETIKRAADASLNRLGVDAIDVYYAHFDDEETPLEETVAAFSELVDAGKVRTIAISNYTAERADEWFRIAREGGLHLPVALQPHYNLVERGYETNGLRTLAERENLGVFAYFGLAKGFLAGKYRSADDVAAATTPRAGGAAAYVERGQQLLAVLDEVAAAHSVAVASVSLAWLREQRSVTAPIASARSLEQLPDLLASMSLELTSEELAALDAASA